MINIKGNSGLVRNLKEYSFGYEGKIRYVFNSRVNEIYFNMFKEPISLTLLKAILKDVEKRTKKEDFEEQLWEEVKKHYKVKKEALFNGNTNPETGKKENLYVLDISCISGEDTHFVCKEILEE